MKSRAKRKSTKALTAADLYWSDEDEDPFLKYVLQVEAPPVDQSDDEDSNAAVFRLEDETSEEASVLHEDHLSEHKRSMLFQGYVIEYPMQDFSTEFFILLEVLAGSYIRSE